MIKYIVKLQAGKSPSWLCTGSGDPSRTLIIESARQFATEKQALRALQNAKRENTHRNFSEAVVQKVYVKFEVTKTIKP